MIFKRFSVVFTICLAIVAIWANSIYWHALGARPGTYGVTVRLPCLSIEYSYWIEHRRLSVFYQRRMKMGGMSSNCLWQVDTADW